MPDSDSSSLAVSSANHHTWAFALAFFSSVVSVVAIGVWVFGYGAKRASFAVRHLLPRNNRHILQKRSSNSTSSTSVGSAMKPRGLRRKSSSNTMSPPAAEPTSSVRLNESKRASSSSASSSSTAAFSNSALKSRSRRFAKEESSSKILEKAFGLPANLSDAIGGMADLATRDFVSSWYYRDVAHDSNERVFVKDYRLMLLDIFGHVAARVGELNVPLVLLDDVSPILRRYVHPESDDPEKWEAAVIKAGFPLHAGAKEPIQHLRKVASAVLKSSLCGNDRNCPTLLRLLVEIVANKILVPVMDACHPYFLNAGFLKSVAAAQPPPSASSTPTSRRTASEDSNSNNVAEAASSSLSSSSSSSSSVSVASAATVPASSSSTSSSSNPTTETQILKPQLETVAAATTISPLLHENYFALPVKPASPSTTSNSLLDAGEKITKAVVVGTELSLDDVGDKRQFDPQPHVEFVIRVTSHTLVERPEAGGEAEGEGEGLVVVFKRVRKTWLIWRRFSQFDYLHKVLSNRHKVMVAKLPSKRGLARVFAGEFDRDFIEDRAANLNRYLESLVNDREVGSDKGNNADPEFVHFFTLGRRDVREKSSSIKIRGGARGAFLDSVRNGNSDEAVVATAAARATTTVVEEEEEEEENDDLLPRRRLSLFDEGEGGGNLPNLMRVPPDVEAHLYDLIDEIFMLERAEFSFLRRNVVALARAIVRTSFKGRIYSWVASWGFERVEAMTRAVESVREAIWPEGNLAPPAVLPAIEIQTEARKRSKRLIKSALPPGAARLVGEAHVHLVADTVHELFQCRLVVRSFVLDALDVVVRRLFPKESEEETAKVVL